MLGWQRIALVLLVIVVAAAAAIFAFPQQYNKTLGSFLPKVAERPFQLGLDLEGGVHLVYGTDLSEITPGNEADAMAGLKDVIERRVNLFGVREPVVQVLRSGDGYRLAVEIAGAVDASEAIELIGQTPFLEFRTERPQEETDAILAKQTEIQALEDPAQFETVDNWELALEDPFFISSDLTGRYLSSAELGFDHTTQEPLVNISFDGEGATIFEELTEANVGRQVAIYIDNQLISAPVVHQRIAGGSAQISGNFTIEEARELARNLSAGALPVPIELIQQEQVGPTLGQISLDRSLRAGLIGFLAIITFITVFYRLPGLLSALALLVYVTVTVALFKAVGVTVTLAGIGGFILSVGMAIDANILILSRLREEFADKGSVAIGLPAAFQRAWTAIRDGNITTLVVALILFSFGTSFVKGFALTLSLGIVVSVVVAMGVTRLLMELAASGRLRHILKLWW